MRRKIRMLEFFFLICVSSVVPSFLGAYSSDVTDGSTVPQLHSQTQLSGSGRQCSPP